MNWANQFNICCFLDNHNYNFIPSTFECLAGVGAASIFAPTENILSGLEEFTKDNQDWLFGHLGFDLKAETAKVPTSKKDQLGFTDIFLFRPETVLFVDRSAVTISSLNRQPSEILTEIQGQNQCFPSDSPKRCRIRSGIQKEKYIRIVEKLQDHIRRGDCYEINFCQEFFSENAQIDPLSTYGELLTISPTPFAGYYKIDDKYLLCASPERFLKKDGKEIISQPVKGTSKRNQKNPMEDERLKNELYASPKERSENVMITDLVRNDLSRICREGSVLAEKLYEIQSFEGIHQMVSSVRGVLTEEVKFPEILRATFPMGSMTGAPKNKVLNLIEKYESSKRGLYSGSLGYITPENNFDWNVVIRSIQYNSSTKYLSFHVGSAITFLSNADQEYKECLLKGAAITKTLTGNPHLPSL